MREYLNFAEDAAAAQRRAERSTWLVRKGRMDDPEMDTDWPPTTPEERLAMVWPLTIQAWAMRGIDVADLRTPRHLMTLTRKRCASGD